MLSRIKSTSLEPEYIFFFITDRKFYTDKREKKLYIRYMNIIRRGSKNYEAYILCTRMFKFNGSANALFDALEINGNSMV